MTTNQPIKNTEFSIHPQTLIGKVSLTVANLNDQLKFYQQVLGFKLHWREDNKAGLGSGGKDFLLLTEESSLKCYRGGTGLYHVAYLYPNKRELAIAMARLFAFKVPPPRWCPPVQRGRPSHKMLLLAQRWAN